MAGQPHYIFAQNAKVYIAQKKRLTIVACVIDVKLLNVTSIISIVLIVDLSLIKKKQTLTYWNKVNTMIKKLRGEK